VVVDIPAAFQLKPPPKLLGRVVSALTRGDRRWRVGDVKTKYSESRLPLNSALAETLFNWKRKSLFGKDTDWWFASAHKAEELPLRSERRLAKQIKPAATAAADWDRDRVAHFSPYLLIDASKTWGRREGAAGAATACRRRHDAEPVHPV